MGGVLLWTQAILGSWIMEEPISEKKRERFVRLRRGQSGFIANMTEGAKSEGRLDVINPDVWK